MDMLKLFETRSGVPRMTVIHDYPKYTFRREGEFFYSLYIQSEDTDDKICEIIFGENDLINLIMKAEMVLHGKKEEGQKGRFTN